MWILFREDGDLDENPYDFSSKRDKWALKTGEVYSVGKGRSDIQPDQDTSVSGKHANISVFLKEGAEIPEVIVEDLSSNYGTFLNEAIDRPAVGTKNFDRRKSGKGITKPTVLKDNDRIKFGTFGFIFRLKWLELEVITSMLKSFFDLNKLLDKLSKTQVNPRWSERTTHLVMEQVQLSPKVLSCLVSQVPIVTTNYFTDFLSAYKTKQRVPDPDNYVPPISEAESQLRHPGVSLTVDPNRRTMFQDKEFIFLDSSQPDLEKVLPMTGATVTHQPLDYKDSRLNSPDVMVVKPKKSGGSQSQDSQAVTSMYLDTLDRIMVSPNAIYMAIVRSDPQACSNVKQQRGSSSLICSSSMNNSQQYEIRAKETVDITSQPIQEGSSVLLSRRRTSRPRDMVSETPVPSTNKTADTMSSMRSSASVRSSASMLPPTIPNTAVHHTHRRKEAKRNITPSDERTENVNLPEPDASQKDPPQSELPIQPTQKKRPLSSESDTEDQENKKPNLDNNFQQFVKPRPPDRSHTTTSIISSVSSQEDFNRRTSTTLSTPSQQMKKVPGLVSSTQVEKPSQDKDDLFDDDEDDDLFGFDGDSDDLPSRVSSVTSSTSSAVKAETGSTLDNKGDNRSRYFKVDVESTSKKRKSTWAQQENDDDVFGFGEDDDEINDNVTAHSNKRLKQISRDEDEEESIYSPIKQQMQSVETKPDPVENSTYHQYVPPPSALNTTDGFLSKSTIKREDAEEMSDLAEEFCTILVSNLIERSPVKSARLKREDCDSSVASRQDKCNLTGAGLSQGRKQFHKQNLRLSKEKVMLTKELIGDEQDRSIAEWFKQNPEASQAIMEEEKQKAAADDLWNFSQSQQRRNQPKLFSTRVK